MILLNHWFRSCQCVYSNLFDQWVCVSSKLITSSWNIQDWKNKETPLLFLFQHSSETKKANSIPTRRALSLQPQTDRSEMRSPVLYLYVSLWNIPIEFCKGGLCLFGFLEYNHSDSRIQTKYYIFLFLSPLAVLLTLPFSLLLARPLLSFSSRLGFNSSVYKHKREVWHTLLLITFPQWLNTFKWVNPLSFLSVVFNNDGPSWISVYFHKYVTKFILSSFRILFWLWMYSPFEAWLWPFDVELQSHMLQSIL